MASEQRNNHMKPIKISIRDGIFGDLHRIDIIISGWIEFYFKGGFQIISSYSSVLLNVHLTIPPPLRAVLFKVA